jgi:hypothetical protein
MALIPCRPAPLRKSGYERQGVLVQPKALEKAKEECLADADLRAPRQERDAERR